MSFFTGRIHRLYVGLVFLAALSIASLLAGCVVPTHAAVFTATNPVEDTPAPLQPTVAPQANTGPSPSPSPVPAACPTPVDGTSLYVSAENGYCLLYPSHFKLEVDPEYPQGGIVLTGPHLTPPPKSQDTTALFFYVSSNGPAGDMDSAAYAARWLELNNTEQAATRQAITIAGQEAVLVQNLSGLSVSQAAFIVDNGYRYSIRMYPQPGEVPGLDSEANLVWNTVTASIVFFEPNGGRKFILAEDVCPAATADTSQYIDLLDGYCLLYPQDFKVSTDFKGQFVGGPVLGTVPDFGEVRTSLTVGTFGIITPGQTPHQLIESRLDFIDQSSIQDAVVGGYPAVFFIDPRGPWASRQAMIVASDDVYTLVAQPYESQRFPAGMDNLNRVWDTVTGSLAFFDKWR